MLKPDDIERIRAISRSYLDSKSGPTLLDMLHAVQGKERIAVHGEEQPDLEYLDDGIYLVEFEGGVGLMVEYTAKSSGGYCETCHYTIDAKAEFTLLWGKI